MGKNDAGVRLWSGLGASNVTEDEMLAQMVDAYNGARDVEDEREIADRNLRSADGKYTDPKYDPAVGEFPDAITKKDVLEAPPYQLGSRTRKGGFVAKRGRSLDADKVAKLSGKPAKK